MTGKTGRDTYNINPPAIHSRNTGGEAEALSYTAEDMCGIFAGAGLGGV